MRLIVTALLAGLSTAHLQRPDLSGTWRFNATQSDNPHSMIDPSDSGGRRGGEGYGGRSPGMGGRGGRGGFGGGRGGFGGNGEGRSDEQRQRMRQTLQLVLQAPVKLSIAESDSTVTIAADTAQPLVIASNGHKMR